MRKCPIYYGILRFTQNDNFGRVEARAAPCTNSKSYYQLDCLRRQGRWHRTWNLSSRSAVRKIKKLSPLHVSIVLCAFKSKRVTLSLGEKSHKFVRFFTSFRMTNLGELKRGPHRSPPVYIDTATRVVCKKCVTAVRANVVAGAQQCEKIKN